MTQNKDMFYAVALTSFVTTRFYREYTYIFFKQITIYYFYPFKMFLMNND